jgi:hypothetical protein
MREERGRRRGRREGERRGGRGVEEKTGRGMWVNRAHCFHGLCCSKAPSMTLDKQPLCLFAIRSSYEEDDLFEVFEEDGSMFIIPILANNFNFWVLLQNLQT